mmetsp:Transcript_11718/g.11636  ORF Transcript_11718/g.11636 Transcript_11718/m.11636 type:complete len:320 (+) Transcript_11718:1246-2205(+)
MCSNFVPYTKQDGLYWMYFMSNDFQLFIIVLMPSVYFYKIKGSKGYTCLYLGLYIVISVLYLVAQTAYNDFSVLVTIYTYQNIFNPLYRKIYGPSGYYALGCLLGLFYYEISVQRFQSRKSSMQAITFSQIETTKVCKTISQKVFAKFSGSYRTRIVFQIIGAVLLIFLIFARFSDFSKDDNNQPLMGKWPHWLNAVWNGVAAYLFIISAILLMNPVLASKLSLIRKFLSSAFFRPLSKLTFCAALLQGLIFLTLYGSQDQKVYFETSNMFFIFLAVLLMSFALALFSSLLFEQPFKLIYNMILCPSKRELRLNKMLAR